MKSIKPLFLSIIFLPFFSMAQIRDKDAYSLLKFHLMDIHTPYVVEAQTLPFENNSINVRTVLNKYFFQLPIVVGRERINIDTVLNDADFNFMMEKSIACPLRYSWDKKKLTKLAIPYRDTLSKEELPGYLDLLRICMPLFSRDKMTALLYADTICEGSCGEGCVYLYSRKSGEWKLLVTMRIWIG